MAKTPFKKPRPDHGTIFDPRIVVLHDYSQPLQSGTIQSSPITTLVVAPLALHDAALADLAPHYSLMEILQANGVNHLVLIEWISATSETAHHTISTQVQLLDRIVDHHGGRANLIGLCQGGWLALIYAALFPHKTNRLVMVGAPVDFHADLPASARTAQAVAQAFTGFGLSQVFDYWALQWGSLAGHVVQGKDVRRFWPYDLEQDWDIAEALQIPEHHSPHIRKQAIDSLKGWDQRLLDLPSPYFWQVLQWLYRDNRLAQGTLYVLGQRIDLQSVTCPIYLLAGERDHIVSMDQILATVRLVATPPAAITIACAPCGHLALFMGHETLTCFWPPIAKWLIDDF